MNEDYEPLLRSSRLRESAIKEKRSVLSESNSDRGRVLFCSAFRRLQQKAQVFSLEPNAAVRSRLTHSLEVSFLGRFLTEEIGKLLKEKSYRLNSSFNAELSSAFVNFVEVACLLHDIGNPPFGHFGEKAIKKWFDDNGEKCINKALPNYKYFSHYNPLDDFKEFDGNPQGLRVITRLQWNKDEYGLNGAVAKI